MQVIHSGQRRLQKESSEVHVHPKKGSQRSITEHADVTEDTPLKCFPTVLTGLVGCRYWTVRPGRHQREGGGRHGCSKLCRHRQRHLGHPAGARGRHSHSRRCALSLSVNWCCATCEPDSQHVCACLDTDNAVAACTVPLCIKAQATCDPHEAAAAVPCSMPAVAMPINPPCGIVNEVHRLLC